MAADSNLVRLCGQAKGGYHPLQASLIDYEPGVQQQLDSAWHQQAQRQADSLLKQEKARQQAAVRIRSAIQSGFLWPGVEKLLEKPLGVHLPTDLDIQPEPEFNWSAKETRHMSPADIGCDDMDGRTLSICTTAF